MTFYNGIYHTDIMSCPNSKFETKVVMQVT